ncbi:hypothetical protein [Anabaena lutea]|uniref:Uncharacterized protein n=1 Tax=Anabaena lutea FACHB-196 TaxID=2692881 RepID=A0ABR8FHH3_9NOST|nr:hypothetical protein [Anabaena lutea]MBD2568165.1 hypothetical protein [Anabaena lutea FACHB-196]
MFNSAGFARVIELGIWVKDSVASILVEYYGTTVRSLAAGIALLNYELRITNYVGGSLPEALLRII